MEFLTGQEVLQGQSLRMKVHIVLHTSDIHLCCSLQRSPTLTEDEIGGILTTISLDIAIVLHGRQVEGLLQRGIQERFHEAKVLGNSMYVDICEKTIAIGNVAYLTVSLQREGCGEFDVHTMKPSMLKISFHHTVNTQRLVRPAMPEVLGHVGEKPYQILLAE